MTNRDNEHKADTMSSEGDTPLTPAVQAATDAGLDLEVVVTEAASNLDEALERLGVDHDHLLRTIVVRRAKDDHLLVLVPASRRLHWPKLRAVLGVSRLSLPDAARAQEVTGYPRGAITPFGTRQVLPVIADQTVVGSGTVTIGGGKHGVSLRVDADALIAAVDATVADVTEPA